MLGSVSEGTHFWNSSAGGSGKVAQSARPWILVATSSAPFAFTSMGMGTWPRACVSPRSALWKCALIWFSLLIGKGQTVQDYLESGSVISSLRKVRPILTTLLRPRLVSMKARCVDSLRMPRGTPLQGPDYV